MVPTLEMINGTNDILDSILQDQLPQVIQSDVCSIDLQFISRDK